MRVFDVNLVQFIEAYSTTQEFFAMIRVASAITVRA